MVNELAIATNGSSVQPPVGGQDDGRRVEFDDCREVVEIALLDRQAVRRHRYPMLPGVVARVDLDTNGVWLGVGGDARGRLPEDEGERHEQVSRVTIEAVAKTGALSNVPTVDAVINELEERIERGPGAAPCICAEPSDPPIRPL